MCAFTFTVFLSPFQLFPTAPFRILDLGGTQGRRRPLPRLPHLRLGLLRSHHGSPRRPRGEAVHADRLRSRHRCLSDRVRALAQLQAAPWRSPSSTASSGRGSSPRPPPTSRTPIPASRRAEGIGYWGLATIIAIAIAPNLGLWIYRHGWVWLCVSTGVLNLGMAAIAASASRHDRRAPRPPRRFFTRDLVEWRVVALSLSLFLYSFGYGGITSFAALCADSRGIAPKGIYFTSFALTVLVTRPLISRFADRVGYLRIFYPCLALIVVGLGLLAVATNPPGHDDLGRRVRRRLRRGYPVYVAHLMKHIDPARRGAAFGGILAAFDTGIGTGSIATGFIVEHAGSARPSASPRCCRPLPSRTSGSSSRASSGAPPGQAP